MKLKISDDLSLPVDAVTQTVGILAIKGAGKTNTAVVLAEEFLKNNLQVVILDPVGVWFGLRSSTDGKSAGLPIIIFGGEKGDVPLEVTGGALVADLVVDEHISAILDLSLFRKGEQARFITDFAERLYNRKGSLTQRDPLHLILDEADAFAPQKPMPGEQRMLGAIDEIVRRGRARGLGVTLITQRSAAINKDVLTQIEVLICLRTISPQDRKAVEAWIEVHGTPEQQKELMASLPSLPRGTAWVWSPGWLDIFKKVKIRQRETFDSSATPKVGDKVIAPKRFADVDIDALKEKMEATIEKAKGEDPKELKKKIAELEVALKKAQNEKPAPEVIEVSVLTDEDRRLLERVSETLNEQAVSIKDIQDFIKLILSKAQEACARGFTASCPSPRPSRAPIHPSPSEGGAAKLSGGQRKIMIVLAQYPEGRTKVQVALLTGYAHKGGSFNNYLSSLRSQGFIEGNGESLMITEAGREALGPYEPLPQGQDLVTYWLRQLGKAEGMILRALLDAYPDALTKEEVAQRTGYEAKGGGFNNALSRLRTLELINGRNEIKAAEELF